MTCLKGEGLDGLGMNSHTSMLRTFFVYTLALSMPIFKKKSPLKRLRKSSKLFIVVIFGHSHFKRFKHKFVKKILIRNIFEIKLKQGSVNYDIRKKMLNTFSFGCLKICQNKGAQHIFYRKTLRFLKHIDFFFEFGQMLFL